MWKVPPRRQRDSPVSLHLFLPQPRRKGQAHIPPLNQPTHHHTPAQSAHTPPSGYDPLDAEDQPGQDRLAHILHAQLLYLHRGSTLYPVVKDINLDWPLQALGQLTHEAPEFIQQKRQELKGEGRRIYMQLALCWVQHCVCVCSLGGRGHRRLN